MALARAGVVVFGLNYKDDMQAARRFIGSLGNPYARIGADTRGRVAIDFGVYGVPETFVIDGTGRIVSRFAGPLDQNLLVDPPIAAAAAVAAIGYSISRHRRAKRSFARSARKIQSNEFYGHLCNSSNQKYILV